MCMCQQPLLHKHSYNTTIITLQSPLNFRRQHVWIWPFLATYSTLVDIFEGISLISYRKFTRFLAGFEST